MRTRRGLAAAVLLVLLGASLLLVSTAGAWSTGTVGAAPPLPDVAVEAPAPDAVRPLGLVALAGAAALLAVRGRGRQVVGGVLLLTAFAAGAVTGPALEDPRGALPEAADASATARPLLALAGSSLVVTGGALAALHGARWPGPSRRYERAPASGAGRPLPDPGTDAAGAWDALDRGEDPTRDRPSPAS
ncbi:MAG TPA: Trp biosynthesis-associated membrane protein [Mycobacteriales bacterium]|nr:Trp biosynthesis-associated membrane protein [Mycobacteriales bacterium]